MEKVSNRLKKTNKVYLFTRLYLFTFGKVNEDGKFRFLKINPNVMTNTELLYTIKRHRKAKGLSQSDMANKLNIVLKTYQNIESGLTRLDLERLKQIAALIDLNLSSIFHRAEELAMEKDAEKELYHKLLIEKEIYISKLENDIKFYQEILREK